MTARDYLEQYKEACRRIRRLEEEYLEETILIDAIRSASDNDGMPHGTGISKPTEEKALRLADKRMRLVDAKLEAIRIRQEVFDNIAKVGGPEAEVLYQRYILSKPWREVCEAVYYSWFKVRTLHADGLKKIEELIN